MNNVPRVSSAILIHPMAANLVLVRRLIATLLRVVLCGKERLVVFAARVIQENFVINVDMVIMVILWPHLQVPVRPVVVMLMV